MPNKMIEMKLNRPAGEKLPETGVKVVTSPVAWFASPQVTIVTKHK